jgi:protein-disulfide isomerase/uncharacterized membrane protein
MREQQDSTKGVRIAVLILGLLGFVISFEALRQHVLHANALTAAPSFCDISSYVSCNKVNASEWSTFLGIPIASYGIFFYLSLVGLSLLSGAHKAVSVRALAAVVLLGGAVSTAISVVLFAISALVIKALCILCIGLYLVNIGLFLFPWLLVFRGEVGVGLRSGVAKISDFLRAALVPSAETDVRIVRGARFSLISLLVLALFSWGTGPVMLKLFLAKTPTATVQQVDPLAVWQGAPLVDIPVVLDKGAFGDFAKGTPDAPIQIVEFADFECPGCRAMYFRMLDLLEAYPGKFHLVFRHYPLDRSCNPGMQHDLHMYACIAAEFSQCAGEQGKFWEATEWLFSAPELEAAAPAAEVKENLIVKGSAQLGLDTQAIRECLSSGRHLKKIQQDIASADRLGLESTPSFWINGRLLRRANPDGMRKVFDHILASQAATSAPRSVSNPN